MIEGLWIRFSKYFLTRDKRSLAMKGNSRLPRQKNAPCCKAAFEFGDEPFESRISGNSLSIVFSQKFPSSTLMIKIVQMNRCTWRFGGHHNCLTFSAKVMAMTVRNGKKYGIWRSHRAIHKYFHI